MRSYLDLESSDHQLMIVRLGGSYDHMIIGPDSHQKLEGPFASISFKVPLVTFNSGGRQPCAAVLPSFYGGRTNTKTIIL